MLTLRLGAGLALVSFLLNLLLRNGNTCACLISLSCECLMRSGRLLLHNSVTSFCYNSLKMFVPKYYFYLQASPPVGVFKNIDVLIVNCLSLARVHFTPYTCFRFQFHFKWKFTVKHRRMWSNTFCPDKNSSLNAYMRTKVTHSSTSL